MTQPIYPPSPYAHPAQAPVPEHNGEPSQQMAQGTPYTIPEPPSGYAAPPAPLQQGGEEPYMQAQEPAQRPPQAAPQGAPAPQVRLVPVGMPSQYGQQGAQLPAVRQPGNEAPKKKGNFWQENQKTILVAGGAAILGAMLTGGTMPSLPQFRRQRGGGSGGGPPNQ